MNVKPVMFPPGRARLATRPMPTGSFDTAKTVGMIDVASFAATAGAPEVTRHRPFAERTRPRSRRNARYAHLPRHTRSRRRGVDTTPSAILGRFVYRWSMETTFQETREHLGVETQRQWSDLAIARTAPALLG